MDITESVTAAEQIEKERNHYHDLFENVPVAISEEDESGMKKYFDSLRAEGVEDFRDYFSRHPEKLHYCSDLGKGTAFNRASFEILEATNYQEMNRYNGAVIQERYSLCSCSRRYINQACRRPDSFLQGREIITARGEVKTVRCYVTIRRGMKENLSRVYIYVFFDINRFKKKPMTS
jgi:PAS domain-containing protein